MIFAEKESLKLDILQKFRINSDDKKSLSLEREWMNSYPNNDRYLIGNLYDNEQNVCVNVCVYLCMCVCMCVLLVFYHWCLSCRCGHKFKIYLSVCVCFCPFTGS